MKKLITLIACLAIVSAGIAQEKNNDKKKFYFGVKGGLNVSNIVETRLIDKDNKDPRANPKAGFHIGVGCELDAGNGFAFAPEILFSNQGCRMDINPMYPQTDAIVTVNYINVPLIARFYVIDCFSVDVAPQVGFATGMKIRVNKESEKVDSKYYNACEFSMGLGVTYNLNHEFFASARYNIGISDVIKDENNTNSVFQLSVGYNFIRL